MIIFELLNKNNLETLYWPLIMNYFMEVTTENYTNFSFANFQSINEIIIKIDQLIPLGKKITFSTIFFFLKEIRNIS